MIASRSEAVSGITLPTSGAHPRDAERSQVCFGFDPDTLVLLRHRQS
jgi:hypothetical protein